MTNIREKFEVFATKLADLDIDIGSDGKYVSYVTQVSFEAYQAGKAASDDKADAERRKNDE